VGSLVSTPGAFVHIGGARPYVLCHELSRGLVMLPMLVFALRWARSVRVLLKPVKSEHRGLCVSWREALSEQNAGQRHLQVIA